MDEWSRHVIFSIKKSWKGKVTSKAETWNSFIVAEMNAYMRLHAEADSGFSPLVFLAITVPLVVATLTVLTVMCYQK